ncbi:hypothetical protein [Enterobacter bugandensis]
MYHLFRGPKYENLSANPIVTASLNRYVVKSGGGICRKTLPLHCFSSPVTSGFFYSQRPPILGVEVRPGSVAIIISLLGGYACARILAWAFEKKTGIKLEKK